MTEGAAAELPRYKCHKEVWALKIAKIEWHVSSPGSTATITPAEAAYAPFGVSGEYMTKHNPQIGGYYVVYHDGYKSFSPARAFEEGYSKV